jgi:cell division protein ZipA
MDDTLKYAIFAIGALIIIGIVWHAISSKSPESQPTQAKKPKAAKSKQSEPKVGMAKSGTAQAESKANEEAEQQDFDLAHEDEEPEVQKTIDRAAEEAIAASRGEPHQVELSFEDEAKNWQEGVKVTFEKRTQKAVDETPVVPVASVPASAPEPEYVTIPRSAPTPAPMPEPEPVMMPVSTIVVLNVMAPRSTFFFGRDIVEVLDQQGLGYGKRGIYHCYSEIDGSSEFYVASAMKPGYFDLENIHQFTTPGLTFFMDLSQVAEPKKAFKHMLTVVHEVARQLGGDILDDHRQRLTQASVSEYLARIKGVEAYRKSANG